MAVAKTSFTRVVFRITGNPGDTKDIDFRPSSAPPIKNGAPAPVSYDTVQVDQTFKEIAIHNLTADNIFYSLDRDIDGHITVDSSFAWGVKTVASGLIIIENPGGIDRLRINFVAVGTVEVILVA